MKNGITIDQVLDTIDQVLLVLDPEHTILWANSAAERAAGLSRTELRKKTCFRLFHNTDCAPANCPLVKAVRSGRAESSDMEVEALGRTFHVTCKPILDPQGSIVGIVHTAVDITEHKKAARTLQDQGYYLEKAQEVGKIGTWHRDLVTDRLAYTDETYRIFGLPPGTQVSYQLFLDTVHPEDADYVDREWTAALTGKPYDIEHRIVVDGRIKWVREKADIEFSDNGRALNAIGITQDITQRKEAEQERQRLEEMLQQSQRLESIGRLAGGVAHDFNNLLTAIRGFSELVFSSLADYDPLRRDVAEIQKAADSAAALTGQLLAFSRRQVVTPRVMDLNKAVWQSENMLRRLIGEDVELVIDAGEDLGRVHIDPTQVDQLLVNLAVNARDAMPAGGKLIIEARNRDFAGETCANCLEPITGEFVEFSVRDTGTGMDEETSRNIFEPFFTTKEMDKGTGLGLSTVHGIVRQNRGHIQFTTRAGEGTAFRILLPRVEGDEAVDTEAAAPDSLEGTETVLLVEDMGLVRKLAVRTLRARGYTVIEAASGGEAFLECEKHGGEIDILVTDVVMPQMSGTRLHERLLKINPSLKVLFISGYTEEAIAHHGNLTPGINFLAKPFRPEELARSVRAVLDS